MDERKPTYIELKKRLFGATMSDVPVLRLINGVLLVALGLDFRRRVP